MWILAIVLFCRDFSRITRTPRERCFSNTAHTLSNTQLHTTQRRVCARSCVLCSVGHSDRSRPRFSHNSPHAPCTQCATSLVGNLQTRHHDHTVRHAIETPGRAVGTAPLPRHSVRPTYTWVCVCVCDRHLAFVTSGRAFEPLLRRVRIHPISRLVLVCGHPSAWLYGLKISPCITTQCIAMMRLF